MERQQRRCVSEANRMSPAHVNGNSDLGQAPGDIWLQYHPLRGSTVLLLCNTWPSCTKCCSHFSKSRRWNADSLNKQKKLINVFYLQLQEVVQKVLLVISNFCCHYWLSYVYIISWTLCLFLSQRSNTMLREGFLRKGCP